MQAQAAAAPTVKPTPKRNSVAHAWLFDPVLLELESEAQRRGLHRDRLTAAIIDKVIRNGLVDTLLDNPRLK